MPWIFVLVWIAFGILAAFIALFTLFFPIGMIGLSKDGERLPAILASICLPGLLWIAWFIAPSVPTFVVLCIALNTLIMMFAYVFAFGEEE